MPSVAVNDKGAGDTPPHDFHSQYAHPKGSHGVPLSGFGRVDVATLRTNDPDQQHKEDFGFRLQFRGELLEKEEHDTRRPQREREVRA